MADTIRFIQLTVHYDSYVDIDMVNFHLSTYFERPGVLVPGGFKSWR